MNYVVTDGGEYKFPVRSNKPFVYLTNLKNNGYNSVTVTCAYCKNTDTYAKSDLENMKVFKCKKCNSAVYRSGFAKLLLTDVTNKVDGRIEATCKCLDCGRADVYNFVSIVNNTIKHCKHCIGGYRRGLTIGTYIVDDIKLDSKNILDTVIIFKCTKCGTQFSATMQSIRNTNLSAKIEEQKFKNRLRNMPCQKCYLIKSKREAAESIPSENDRYCDIKLDSKNSNRVFATCKNCGITTNMSKKDVLDMNTCYACRFVTENSKVRKVKMGSDILNRKFNNVGKKIIEESKGYFSLNVDSISDVAKQYKDKRKVEVSCTCSTCNYSDSYEIKDISGEFNSNVTCKLCGYKHIIGEEFPNTRTGSTLTLTSMQKMQSRSKATLKCSKCGANITTDVSDILNRASLGCETCNVVRKYNIGNSAEFGSIFNVNNKEHTDYQIVGTYMILKNEVNQGKISVKAQCIECGNIIDRDYDKFDAFVNDVISGCRACETLKKRTKNYINNNNWVNYIKNCRKINEVIDRDGTKIAVTECLICGDIKEIPLTVFILAEKLVCQNCINSKVIVRCPVCKGFHDLGLTIQDLYNSTRDIVCANTKKSMSIYSIRMSHEKQCKLDYLISNFPDFGDYIEIPGTGLIKSTDKSYVGTDGVEYHTCYCEDHNKLLTLTDDEIRSYEHQFCADTRMYGYL